MTTIIIGHLYSGVKVSCLMLVYKAKDEQCHCQHYHRSAQQSQGLFGDRDEGRGIYRSVGPIVILQTALYTANFTAYGTDLPAEDTLGEAESKAHNGAKDSHCIQG